MCEKMVVRYCSPTLAGLKTANAFTYFYPSQSELYTEIYTLNRRLSDKGLRVLPLKIDERAALIYVYRPNMLARDLSDSSAEKILAACGYTSLQPSGCIERLAMRLRTGHTFPHEIGLFLGYPPEDVKGFMENNAQNYKSVGAWKVYGDEVGAERLFARYKKCTDVYLSKFASGKRLEDLAVSQ